MPKIPVIIKPKPATPEGKTIISTTTGEPILMTEAERKDMHLRYWTEALKRRKETRNNGTV